MIYKQFLSSCCRMVEKEEGLEKYKSRTYGVYSRDTSYITEDLLDFLFLKEI